MALDAKLRIKEARKTRYASYDAKRKGLVEELEERERALKKARLESETEKKQRLRENERIMEEGRQLREQRERELQRKEHERETMQQKVQQEANAGVEPPPSGSSLLPLFPGTLFHLHVRPPGPLDTTVRVKYALASRPTLVDAASIGAVLAPFGAIDESSVVLSLKPAPPKKPKRGTALVPFTQIGGAFAAVCASERAEHGLQDIEVTWAGGAEPEIIGWLKKMGQLGGTANVKPPPSANHKSSAPISATPASDETFSSFPSTFVRRLDFDVSSLVLT